MMTANRVRTLPLLLSLSLFAGACAGASRPGTAPAASEEPGLSRVETPLPAPGQDSNNPESAAADTSCEDPFAGLEIRFRTDYWPETDFCRHSVPLTEFRAGGPPPDGIPAIDQPTFEDLTAGDEWLGEQWPVISMERDGEARAYPLAMLLLHEIINDEIAGQPIAVTYCPLCNAAVVFDRTLDGQVLDFGTSGNLRNSDLVMYDRQTHSWWQQLTGEAVVGQLTGSQLDFLSSRTISWEDFKTRYPQGVVLSREAGLERYRDLYGTNPYPGLDSSSTSPFGVGNDDRLNPMERVVALELDDQPVAYPFSQLKELRVVNDEIAAIPIVVFWQDGVKSALDGRTMGESRDVGSTAVYERSLNGRSLTFKAGPEAGMFIDEQTGSRWNIFGEAVEGPLAGETLQQLVSAEHFWFAWAAFNGATDVRLTGS